MAGNKVTLTFAGDADSLSKAAKQAEKSTADLGTKLSNLGNTVSGATDALDSLGGGLQAVVDLQQASAVRADRLARAFTDVEQAQEDLQQALRDGKQASLDADQAMLDIEQANIDASVAMKEYNKAVKEYGPNSDEARQAALDLKQAQQDVKQAQEDSEQAARDLSQSTIDAKTAQVDLNEANREAHPPELQKWAEGLQLVTPLLTAIVGVVGLVTAAQWLWNASLWASPVTWIVLAVAALVAIIVIIATKTEWFQKIWDVAWGGIKKAAEWAWDKIKGGAKAVWDYLGEVWDYITGLPEKLKKAFAKVTDFITAPFKAAFNYVAKAWNGTIGKLSWTVPGWVPGVGGKSISAPQLPTYHQGGIVSGALGSETLAVLQAGERVTPAGGGHAEEAIRLEAGDEFGELLLNQIRRQIGLRGGDPVRVLRGSRG